MAAGIDQGVRFTHDESKAMAVFVAQLVREGVLFETLDTSDGWIVTLTGGY